MRDWFAAFRQSPGGSNFEQPAPETLKKGVAGCDWCGTIEIIEEIAPHPRDAVGVAGCGTRSDHGDLPHLSHPVSASGVAEKALKNQGRHTCHTCHTPKGDQPHAKGTNNTAIVPSVDEFEERAAIIAEGCGIAQSAATEAAAYEFGFVGADQYCSATVSAWQSAIARLPTPLSTDGQKLLDTARWFLGSPFCEEAIRCGWSELELFGCHERKPLARLDAMGLIPTLAWSKLDAKLRAIDHEAAVLETRSGSQLTHWRFRTENSEAVRFWDHHLLVGE